MIALLVGCSIGLVLGLTGAGGSVLAVPLFVFLLGFAPETAVAASLATVFCSALLGVLTRLKKKETAWMPALFFSVGGLLFAPLGVYLAQFFSPHWHLGSFTVLMLIIAFRMLVQSVQSPMLSIFVRAQTDGEVEQSSPLCPLSETNQFEPRLRCIGLLASGGALTGVLSGIYGVGGGFLIVPILTAITQLNMRQAVGTSLFVITVISGAGFLGYVFKDGFDAIANNTSLPIVVFGSIIGMLIGTMISKRIAGARLQQLFVVAVVSMAAFTLFNIDSIPVK